MKVLVFTSLYPNNVHPDNGVFIKNRMEAFSKIKNCEIKVVAPVPYCPPFRFLGGFYEKYAKIKKKELIGGIEVYHPKYFMIPKVSMPVHGFLIFLFSLCTVIRIKRKYDFDLLDVHYVYPDGYAGMLLAKLLNKPFFVSARGSDINQFLGFKLIKSMIKKVLLNSNHIISVSNALKEKMKSIGASDNKISVISNGVDLELFRPLSKKSARSLLGIKQDDKVILSVGSLIPRKGHHIVIESMPDILKKIPEAKFYIAGEGEMKESLEASIKGLGLSSQVKLLGHIPNKELCLWYCACDVFCLASSREGWANVIMEALASGRPVVATNVWGAPEIITNSDVGMLTERTSKSISDNLVLALSNNWDDIKIREHVKKRTWDAVAGDVFKVFHENI